MRRLLLAVLLTVGLSLGLVAASSASAEATPKPGTPAHWQNDYYRNYFKTIYTCNKWGEGAKHGNEVQKKIPYVDGYRCVQHAGDKRWSINLHWQKIPPCTGTGAGCGGGGGGSGSWVVKGYAA
jgi:hypothetical protein